MPDNDATGGTRGDDKRLTYLEVWDCFGICNRLAMVVDCAQCHGFEFCVFEGVVYRVAEGAAAIDPPERLGTVGEVMGGQEENG